MSHGHILDTLHPTLVLNNGCLCRLTEKGKSAKEQVAQLFPSEEIPSRKKEQET